MRQACSQPCLCEHLESCLGSFASTRAACSTCQLHAADRLPVCMAGSFPHLEVFTPGRHSVKRHEVVRVLRVLREQPCMQAS